MMKTLWSVTVPEKKYLFFSLELENHLNKVEKKVLFGVVFTDTVSHEETRKSGQVYHEQQERISVEIHWDL